MQLDKNRVVVAMSGGVDSSVAACLLHDQGMQITGLFMRTGSSHSSSGKGCCSASDANDARLVAGYLEVPFYALNFQSDFNSIKQHFANEYAEGRTPNPCIVCNSDLKFGKLLEYADSIGAYYIATGHYARIDRSNGTAKILTSLDSSKDQTYVLFDIDPKILDRILFPIGHLNKTEVRKIAASKNLPNHNKPDSVDICFVPDGNYADVIKEMRPDAFEPGDIINEAGETIGTHNGIGNYTIGQRKGLNIRQDRHKKYVVGLNVLNRTITVANSASKVSNFIVERPNLLADVSFPLNVKVKIRSHHTPENATINIVGDKILVSFETEQSSVTPGQAAVFYQNETLIGGGWIEKILN